MASRNLRELALCQMRIRSDTLESRDEIQLVDPANPTVGSDVLNIGRLRVLRELHQRKTLTAVAVALSYSTSAVSQQLRLLEKEVGVPLVEPIGRRLQLTPQGLILVGHTDRLLALMEAAEADVSSSIDQPRGTLRIAAFQSAALTLVPRALEDLKQAHPHLTVVFEQGEPEVTLPGLASSDFQLVIAESYPGMPLPVIDGVNVEPILADPLWLTMCDEIADSLDPESDILSQLHQVAWAVEPMESASRRWITSECRNAGFEPQVVCSSDDVSVHVRFVEAGLAVAALPGLTLDRAPTLRRFPFGPDGRHRQILLATRTAAQRNPAIIAATAALKRAAAEHLTTFAPEASS